MYEKFIKNSEQALCHLFLHCCFKDGLFTTEEIDDVSEKFTSLGMHKNLNFKDELMQYRSYKQSITDDKSYVEELIKQINPFNDLALYSYCVELGLSDNALEFTEQSLLKNIAEVLNIDEQQQDVIQKLTVQRKVVQTQKFF
jgi:uncharacterized tellurite resistance protein B-like protein